MVLLFLLGGLGMYLWTAGHYAGDGPLVAAGLYTLLPYHLFDLYTRGAIAEFGALAVAPFLFLGIDWIASSSRQRGGVALIAISTACLLLMHNLSAVMAAPFAGIYLLC